MTSEKNKIHLDNQDRIFSSMAYFPRSEENIRLTFFKAKARKNFIAMLVLTNANS
jgi:hypothetical protein